MEEKKLTIDVQANKRDLPPAKRTTDSPDTRLELDKSNNRIITDGPNDNWFEFRFSGLGPDRRGYHSTFLHNKKYLYPRLTF
jgi:hypothetical protein